MIHTWPEALPKPERSTWQRTSQDARLKRGTDQGPVTYRRRFSSVAKTVNLSVVLNRNEVAIFDVFFHDQCKEGTDLFWMPDPTTDGWPLLTSSGQPMLMADGTPILLSSKWLCSFGNEVPVETIVGQVEFRKSFSVQVMP